MAELQDRLEDYSRRQRAQLQTILNISGLAITMLGFVMTVAIVDAVTLGYFDSTQRSLLAAIALAASVGGLLLYLQHRVGLAWLARVEEGGREVLERSPAILQIMTGQLSEELPAQTGAAVAGSADADILQAIDSYSAQLDRIEPALQEVGRRRAIWQAAAVIVAMILLAFMVFTPAGQRFNGELPLPVVINLVLLPGIFGPVLLRRIAWRFLLAEEVARRLRQ